MRPGWPQALMVLPTQGLLVLVIGLPSLWVFWLSLQQTAFGEAPVYVGWSNYAFVLTDPYFWRAFLNTFLVVNIVVYLELALALGMAVLFAAGVPLRRLMIAVVLAPYAVSEVIAVIVWKYMLEPDVGIVSQALAAVGIPELAWTTDRWAALTLVALLSGVLNSVGRFAESASISIVLNVTLMAAIGLAWAAGESRLASRASSNSSLCIFIRLWRPGGRARLSRFRLRFRTRPRRGRPAGRAPQGPPRSREVRRGGRRGSPPPAPDSGSRWS